MTINEVSLNRRVVSWCCQLTLFRFALKFFIGIFPPYGTFPLLQWFVGIRSLFLTLLLYHLLLGIQMLLFSVRTVLLYALTRQGWISDVSTFSNSSMSAIRIPPFLTPSAPNACPRNIQGKTFVPNWWRLD